MKWLDLNRDGRVNTADLLIGIVYLCAAILGLTLMIGTMQWYDVELVRGASLAEVGKWADYVATFVALITIGYAAVVTGVIEYINIDSRSAGGSTYTSARPIVKATVPRMSLPEGDEQLEELKFIAPQSTSKGNGAGEDHPQQANFQRPPVRR